MPVRLRWSAMTISVPGPYAGFTPPAALVRITSRAPSSRNSSTGWTTRPGALPSYSVEPTLQDRHRHPGEGPEQEPAGVTRSRRGGPAGELTEWEGDRVLELVGEAAEPRSQDDAGARDQVGPGANGGDERRQPGRLVGGRDRSGAIDVWHAAEHSPGHGIDPDGCAGGSGGAGHAR